MSISFQIQRFFSLKWLRFTHYLSYPFICFLSTCGTIFLLFALLQHDDLYYYEMIYCPPTTVVIASFRLFFLRVYKLKNIENERSLFICPTCGFMSIILSIDHLNLGLA